MYGSWKYRLTVSEQNKIVDYFWLIGYEFSMLGLIEGSVNHPSNTDCILRTKISRYTRDL